MKTYLTLIILILTLPTIANSQCRKVSFDHLNNSTVGGFCFTCDQNRNQTNQSQVQQVLKPTLTCFQQSIKSRPGGRNTFCKNGSPPLVTGRQSMCTNDDDYTQATAKVFHEVSQCLNIKRPGFLFALLNRESRFQISARSHTGASCYGQLTGTAIADINGRYLPAEVKDPSKCKSINTHFKRLETHGRARTKASVCTAHSNPYSCLFYSALYYQTALKKARNLVKNLKFYSVILKSKPNQTLIFSDKAAFDNYIQSTTQNDIKIKRDDIHTEKAMPVFQDEEVIAQAIAFQGYNGGPQGIRNLFKTYVNTIKTNLWSNTNNGNLYRKAIFGQKPTGIPSSDFIHTFRKYVKNNYSVPQNAEETGNFPTAVFNDFASITKENPACGDIPPNLTKPKNQFNAQGMI